MYYWKKNVIILISIVFLLGLFLYLREREINYTPTAYEKKLIEYFKEIALQSEYDDNPQKVIKWKEPMVLYVIKEEEFKPQMLSLKSAIDEINRLATDGFKIILTKDLSKSNSVLYLCDKERVAELNPSFYRMFTDGIDYEISGMAYSEFNNETFIIDRSLIFINSEETIDMQESTILEEITQSLGLAFDSEMYPNSVFYKNKSERKTLIEEYSVMDKDIVRLLYHPEMKLGSNSTEVEKIIKKILKSEKD